jgi:hypothetical protein
MIRIIKIYEPDRLIVVLAKSHTSPGDIAETVLGYLYDLIYFNNETTLYEFGKVSISFI